MLPEYIKKYDFNEIDNAPSSPGIYAWYAKLHIGVADWRENIDHNNNDLGEINLRQLLALHSGKHDPPNYEMKAKSNFELEWQGELKPQLAQSFDKYLTTESEDAWQIDDKQKLKEIKKIQIPFKKEKTRATLVRLLEASTPFFASPIYIGKSDNIKRRLKEHTDSIKKFSRALSVEPEKRDLLIETIRNSESTFAARVTALGFAPEQLQVYVFDLPEFQDGKYSKDDFDAFASTIEWLLNRWHRPIAGRI